MERKYDFSQLSAAQRAILANGGWRPGEGIDGVAHHSKPSKPCIEGLVRRGFIFSCQHSDGIAYAVYSEVAAAYRQRCLRLSIRRAKQDLKKEKREHAGTNHSQ